MRKGKFVGYQESGRGAAGYGEGGLCGRYGR